LCATLTSTDKTNSARKNIVKYLQDARIRIDGVGLQGHLVAGSIPTLADQIANLKAFEKLRVVTAYTEVDVRIDLPVNDAKFAQQAKDYATTVKACMEVDSCIGFTIWDFYDPVCKVLNSCPYTVND